MVNRIRIQVVAIMAGCTFGTEAAKQTGRNILMAALALQRGMCSEERKSVYMSIGILHDFAPAANAVAFLAVSSELAAMNIRMAIRALLSDSGENQLYMALFAVETRMHAH